MSWGSNPLGLQEQFGVPGFVSSGQARPGDWQMRSDTNPFHRRPAWTPFVLREQEATIPIRSGGAYYLRVDGPGGLELSADDGCGRVVTATASIQGDMGLTSRNPLGGSVTAYANRMGDMQTTNWNGYGGMVTASANRAGALQLTGTTPYGSASAEMNTFSGSYSVDARSFCDRQWVMGAAGGFGFSSPGAGGSSFFGAPNTNGFLLQSRNPAAASGSGESEEVVRREFSLLSLQEQPQYGPSLLGRYLAGRCLRYFKLDAWKRCRFHCDTTGKPRFTAQGAITSAGSSVARRF